MEDSSQCLRRVGLGRAVCTVVVVVVVIIINVGWVARGAIMNSIPPSR